MAGTMVRDLRANISLDVEASKYERGMKSAEESARVFERALREQEAATRRQQQQLDKFGTFAETMSRRVTAAFKSLPKLEINADTSDAHVKIQAVRDSMEELSSKRVGVDIDAATAMGELAAIKDALKDISEGADLDVRVDLAAALTQLEAFEREVAKLDGKTVDVPVDVDKPGLATRAIGAISGGIASLAEVGPAKLGLVAVAIGSLPVVASAAGGAITLSLGGALLGLGLAASKGSDTAKAALAHLKDAAKTEAELMGQPFEHVWVTIVAVAERELRNISPVVRSALAALAPDVESFVDQAGSSFRELGPAIDSVQRAFSAVLQKLGPAMPGIMQHLASAIQEVTSAVEENPDVLPRLIDGLVALVEWGGKAIGTLTRMADWMHENWGALDRLFMVLTPATGALKALGIAGDEAGDGVKTMGSEASTATGSVSGLGTASSTTAGAIGVQKTAMQELNDVMADGKSTADDLKGALDRLTGAAFDGERANQAYESAIDDATKSVKENGRTLDIHTEKGRNNRQALFEIAEKANDVRVAMLESKRPMEEVAEKAREQREAFIRAAEKMGMARSEAEKLATKLGLIKSPKPIQVTANTKPALDTINQLITTASGKVIRIGVDVRSEKQEFSNLKKADGGIVEYYAAGGVRESHVAQIAPAGAMRVWAEPETGGEAYIPLATGKRARSLEVLQTVARQFGRQVVEIPGSTGGGFASTLGSDTTGGTLRVSLDNLDGMTSVLDDTSRALSASFTSTTAELTSTMGASGTLTGAVGELGSAAGDLGDVMSDAVGDLSREISRLSGSVDHLASAVSSAVAQASTSSSSGSSSKTKTGKTSTKTGTASGDLQQTGGKSGKTSTKTGTTGKSGKTSTKSGTASGSLQQTGKAGKSATKTGSASGTASGGLVDYAEADSAPVVVTPAALYADGGIRMPMVARRPTVLFGEPETGGEAFIPLGAAKRSRSEALLSEVARAFGGQYVRGAPSGQGASLAGMAAMASSLSDIIGRLQRMEQRSPVTVENLTVREEADVDRVADNISWRMYNRG